MSSVHEEWRPVVGYEGLYSISNLGRLRREKSNGQFSFVSGSLNRSGYHVANLQNSGKGKHFFVHRLVLQAFCPTDNPNLEVNHIDSNRSNNCLSNLEWMTRKANMRHAKINGRLPRGEAKLNAKLTEPEVRRIRQMARLGYSNTHIAKLYGIHAATVRNIVIKKSWAHVL